MLSDEGGGIYVGQCCYFNKEAKHGIWAVLEKDASTKGKEITELTLIYSTMLFSISIKLFPLFSYFVQPALMLDALSYVSHLSFFTQVRF